MTSEILSPNKYSGRQSKVRLIVIHTMEVDENGANVAESVARQFANPARKASAHICVDVDSEVRCVADADTAWAAPGANADGLQIELAGRASQTTGDWADAASQAILERAAQRVAIWCRDHGIPVRQLSDAELAAGASGIIGHAAASRVYKKSSHWDPGTSFPWESFLARVNAILGQPAVPAPAPAQAAPSGPVVIAPGVPAPAFPLPEGHVFGPKSGPAWMHSGFYNHREDLRRWQQRMKDRGWAIAADGLYGDQTAGVTEDFQREKGLKPDRLIGPITWAAAWTAPVTR